jgi:DNA-binding CsgD family transcriptional regulator
MGGRPWRPTKEIARSFGISPRTVDVHRHHILKKMGTTSLVTLMRGLDACAHFDALWPAESTA